MSNQQNYSSSVLAFVGDAVYSLFVREALAHEGNRSSKALHSRAVMEVRAVAQSKAYSAIIPMLTEKEIAVLRRGKNSNCGNTPHGVGRIEYQKATAVECLFGWLWLNGYEQRAKELFAICRQIS